MVPTKRAKITISKYCKANWDLNLRCERTLAASLLRFLRVCRLDPMRCVRKRLVFGGRGVKCQSGVDARVIAGRGVAVVVLQKVGYRAEIRRERERERKKERKKERGGERERER